MTAPVTGRKPSDQDCIARWQAGDEAGAAELVRRHGPAVAAYLSASGADGADVEDLVQETLFRAFRRIASYQARSSFRTWLIAIASNALKDHWRRGKRRKVVPIGERDFEDGAAAPAEEMDARDALERLGRAVKGLPRLQRDVFLMRAQQGAEYQDIATALGTTPGAARVHYHHAVKRLKELVRT